jgi:hypothetical protein
VTTAGNCTSGTATASVAVTFVPNCVAQTNSCSGFTMISSTSNTGRSWNATSAYCSSLEGGWRVPSLSGLQCICENKSAIPGLLSTGYWSNYGLTLVYAAALDMATCAPGEAQMSAELRVLCVR